MEFLKAGIAFSPPIAPFSSGRLDASLAQRDLDVGSAAPAASLCKRGSSYAKLGEVQQSPALNPPGRVSRVSP
jgi:hypothetical protein